jgi:hypothetical protein
VSNEVENQFNILKSKTESLDSIINKEASKILQLDSIITTESEKIKKLDTLINKSTSTLDTLSKRGGDLLKKINF